MRNIILAVVIAVGAGAIIYVLIGLLGEVIAIPDTVKSGVAGIPALAIQKTYGLLEERSAKRALTSAAVAPQIALREFHPLTAFLFSFIAWCGVVTFTGALMASLVGFAAAIADVDPQQQFGIALVAATTIPLKIIGAAYIGRWIGTRSRPYVFAIIASALVLGSIACLFSMSLVFSEDSLKLLSDYDTTSKQYASLVPDLAVYLLFAALGFWFGQRRKLAYHMGFILRVLPEKTQQTIVEMAKEEALRGRPAATAH
jgi:hypothetical protein